MTTNSKTLADIFGDTVMLRIKAAEKEEILAEMVAEICSRNKIKKSVKEKILSEIMAREELGSTGIGSGAAVPHAKVPEVKKLFGAFAHTTHPVDYDAVDGEPVHLFFLLISPGEGTAEYLQALSCLSRGLRDKKFCRFLMAATTKKDVLYTLKEVPLTTPQRN